MTPAQIQDCINRLELKDRTLSGWNVHRSYLLPDMVSAAQAILNVNSFDNCPCAVKNLNFFHIGFGAENTDVRYVMASPSKIYFALKDRPIAMSGSFSGCYMFQFTFSGNDFFGHIYLNTHRGNPNDDTRALWNTFINTLNVNRDMRYSNFILFEPLSCVDPNNHPPYNTILPTPWAIIDDVNNCYYTFANLDSRTVLPVYPIPNNKLILVNNILAGNWQTLIIH